MPSAPVRPKHGVWHGDTRPGGLEGARRTSVERADEDGMEDALRAAAQGARSLQVCAEALYLGTERSASRRKAGGNYKERRRERQYCLIRIRRPGTRPSLSLRRAAGLRVQMFMWPWAAQTASESAMEYKYI
jgi:hypothetical protein